MGVTENKHSTDAESRFPPPPVCMRVTENTHSTDAESPAPPPRVYMRGI